MIEITQKEFEENFDSYMDRVEKNKEEFLIRTPDGKGFAMIPQENFIDPTNYETEN